MCSTTTGTLTVRCHVEVHLRLANPNLQRPHGLHCDDVDHTPCRGRREGWQPPPPLSRTHTCAALSPTCARIRIRIQVRIRGYGYRWHLRGSCSQLPSPSPYLPAQRCPPRPLDTGTGMDSGSCSQFLPPLPFAGCVQVRQLLPAYCPLPPPPQYHYHHLALLVLLFPLPAQRCPQRPGV